MATESGNPNPPLASTALAHSPFGRIRAMLEEEPFRVHFFQAVRMLQRMEKDRGPVGHFITPQGETIRFTALTTLGFPASELYELERTPKGQMQMTVQFMGLCAAISVMPASYTEFVMARIREKDYVMEDFFNIFNHRMISFFYRGWEKYRFFVQYEYAADRTSGSTPSVPTQPNQARVPDRLSHRLLDLIGLGTKGLQSRGGLADDAYLNYIGLLGRHVRSSASLQQILEDYFGVQVKIEQFAGAWRKLQPENQTSFTGRGGPSERLGVGVVAGDEVWDHHGRIRIALGPMPFAQYLRLLPGQDAYRELAAWLRFYSNGAYETEVQLILLRDDVPACQLGAKGVDKPQLGFVSWLKTRPLQRDPADATYLIQ